MGSANRSAAGADPTWSATGHVDWDGRILIVRSAAPEAMAEGDAVFVSADPRHRVLLEE